MKRRTFLSGVVTIPALAGGIATASIIDPHPEWVKQWRKAHADWLATPEGSTEHDQIEDCQYLLSDRIIKTPARTQEGINAQIQLMCEDVGYDLSSIFGEDFLASICGKRITT